MIQSRFLRRRILSSLFSGLLVLSFILAPVSDTLTLRNVVAAVGGEPVSVTGGPGSAAQIITKAEAIKTTIQATISAGANKLVASLTDALVQKEYVWDGIAWGLTNRVLEEMIRSTTRWVNSGFQGSPAFVTDLNGFLTDLADRVAGEIIWGSDFALLCSPFRLNIQLALDLQYRSPLSYQTMCRLSDVIDNVEAFLDGDFLAGGWDGWYNVALVQQNNPYGAMLKAETILRAGLQSARGEQLNLLGFGKGFLSKEECEVVSIDEMGNAIEGNCSIVTPGSVIQEQLNHSLGLPQDRLSVADEIDELFGALLSQLVSTALGARGGLRGLTDSRYGSGDYFERVATERQQVGVAGGRQPIATAIETETTYHNYQQQIVSAITNANTYKNQTYGTTSDCHSGELTTSLQSKLTRANTEETSSAATLLQLRTLQTDLTALENPATPQALIQTLLTRYGARTIPEARSLLMSRFMTLQTSGLLHTPSDNVTLNLVTIPRLTDGDIDGDGNVDGEIPQFKKTIDDACRLVRFNGFNFGGANN